jgi:beta-glucosidase
VSTAELDIEEQLRQLDLDTKAALLTGVGFWRLPPVPAIGLRAIVMSDGPIGVRGTAWAPHQPSVALPSPTALAACWDVELAREVGRVLGRLARRRGVDVLLAPLLNLQRSPLAGRHFESYSEDPLLTGVLAAGYVTGVQQTGVAAMPKAFVGNDSESERLTVDVRIGTRALRELYLAPFEAAVRDGRAWTVMAAYNRVNGIAMTQHQQLLQDVLKGEWDFDGVVVSDWTAAHTTVETAAGGLDVAMPAMANPWGAALADAVRDGRLAEEVLDDHVRRVLRLAARVGAFDGPPAGHQETDVSVDGARIARILASRSFVLARNTDHTLPLDADRLQSLALIGSAAADIRAFGGGSAEVIPPHVVSPLAGLAEALPGVDLRYAVGTDPRWCLPAAAGPDWPRGFTVCLRDRAGRELCILRTDVGQVRWYGDPPDGVDPDTVEFLELSGEIVPHASGVHTLAVTGLGPATLTVDGVVMLTAETPGADPGAAFGQPPEQRTGVPLTAGRAVRVSVRQRLARVDGLPVFVSLRLGHLVPRPGEDVLMDQAVQVARDAEVAVVVVGTTEDSESEGLDRVTLELPGRQDELVSRVAAVNSRTVVVVNAGAPVLMPWADDVAAILLVWFPGQEAGYAIADVLLGAREPGGRLPVTWPREQTDVPVLSTTPSNGILTYDEGIFIGYRAWQRSGRRPLYPFGHGLGYTTWTFEQLTVDDGDGLGIARVRLRNIGHRHGRHVVQIYLAPSQPDVARPPRWLAGFAVAEAGPGRAVTVEVPLPLRAVQVFDESDSCWRTVAGQYLIEAGSSVEDRPLTARVRVVEAAHPPR